MLAALVRGALAADGVTMKTVVGILTCAGHLARQEACRETWVRRLTASPDVTVVFLEGAAVQAATLHGDVLALPCGDDYYSLAHKTAEFCRWALARDFDYLFKCDDDTFVVAERFLRFDPRGREYIGVDPVDHVNPRFASGGAGYWLSRRAAECVAAMDVERTIAASGVNAEDYCVYWALRDRFAFYNDQRFQAWNQPHRIPKASNEIITAHYIQPEEMRRLDRYFDELERCDGYVGYDRGNNTRFAKQFGELQIDWLGSIGRHAGPIVLQESLSVAGDGAHHFVRASGRPAFTYLRRLDGFENFRFAALPYDFDYMPLVVAEEPLDRINKAAYVFSRKTHSYRDDALFGVAAYRCNYQTRYQLSQCRDYVDCSPCGASVLDKIRHLSTFKFAIACENLIADGYITEKLLDCFQADTVPIYVGGWLPDFLECCVVRLDDISSVSAMASRLAEIFAMPDEEYLAILARISAMRFGHELHEMFSHRSFFGTIGLDVDTSRIRIDGSTD
jgi:hypothetical protein